MAERADRPGRYAVVNEAVAYTVPMVGNGRLR
jgi:hypothetical protein